jgi:hypothetical protein
MSSNRVCLRHGYGNCKCEYCLPWIAKWEKELDGFALFNKLKDQDKPLYIIYEKMSAEFSDLLLIHHEYLEELYLTHKSTIHPRNKKRKSSSPKSSPEPETECCLTSPSP